ncbi:unnamed protein product (macronuclear) [Paramecium tetraurelia]|uniref:Uncharacterized protein n=1 Tax=Paramecium tetraurelia TaxID=5888 RepID=A0BRY1_PARTE|nr:uncharacterized protein GSPATT00031529001 [Paramecium tetraurelia]CAK61298.1 unnamed protein product [Paramecium tetraurelia]|eukprot:XP_001428696.1 hypothetical protein (macronuclear) [Paramecium tetraurelia strain d4-2]
MQMIIYTAVASKKSKQKNYEYLNETVMYIVLTVLVSFISFCILLFIIMACLHQRGYRFIKQEKLHQNEIQQQQQMIVIVPPHEKQQYKQFLYDVNQTMDISRLSDHQ